MIYNHGSRAGHEREERPFAFVGEMLSKSSSFVVIVPERRGYGRSEGAPFSEEIGQDKGPRFVNRLEQEADDVVAAAEFAKTLPYVDGTRREGAAQIRIPLLGMVAENDRTTQAVKAVVEEAQKHGGNTKLIVYPAFTPREKGDVAPGHMIFSVQGARLWERDVHEFLAAHLTAQN